MRRFLIIALVLILAVFGGMFWLGQYAQNHPAPGQDKEIPVNDILSR